MREGSNRLEARIHVSRTWASPFNNNFHLQTLKLKTLLNRQ
jgi:hypothetical protein